MPVHDWTRVEAGVFHAFHVAWISEIQKTLNGGILPQGYYALAEQHWGQSVPDVLTLHASPPPFDPWSPAPDTGGGTAVAEAPPKVRLQQTLEISLLSRRRTVAVRHVTGHRLIAMIEVVSPSNKDRSETVESFVAKALSALQCGVHLLVADLFPPGRHDPRGFHGAIRDYAEVYDDGYDLPPDEPMTLAAYAAGPQFEAYIEHLSVGANMPVMPLFLRRERYVNVPLQSTYDSAFAGMPGIWREVLEAGPAGST